MHRWTVPQAPQRVWGEWTQSDFLVPLVLRRSTRGTKTLRNFSEYQGHEIQLLEGDSPQTLGEKGFAFQRCAPRAPVPPSNLPHDIRNPVFGNIGLQEAAPVLLRKLCPGTGGPFGVARRGLEGSRLWFFSENTLSFFGAAAPRSHPLTDWHT